MIDDFFTKARPDIERDVVIRQFNRETEIMVNRRAEQLRSEKQQRKLEQWEQSTRRLAQENRRMAENHLINVEIARRRAGYAVISQILWGSLAFVSILTILLVLSGVL